MSKIVVDLQNKEEDESNENVPEFSAFQQKEKRGIFVKVLKILTISVAALLLISLIGGFFYWRYLKTTPQYSLALIINAARRDDKKAIDELVDLDAIVEDFLPQVVNKAVELYGRGVDPEIIKKATVAAAPLLPVVKLRAKAELPDLIAERTKRFKNIPFWVIAVGAKRYLNIEQKGDKATITSKSKERPLEFEMKMNGTKWQIVAVKDEQTAQNIARKIGQEVLMMAKSKDSGTIENVGRQIGLDNAPDLLKQVEGIFK